MTQPKNIQTKVIPTTMTNFVLEASFHYITEFKIIDPDNVEITFISNSNIPIDENIAHMELIISEYTDALNAYGSVTEQTNELKQEIEIMQGLRNVVDGIDTDVVIPSDFSATNEDWIQYCKKTGAETAGFSEMKEILISLNSIIFDEVDNNSSIRKNIKIYNELMSQANRIDSEITTYFKDVCHETHTLEKNENGFYTFSAKERITSLVELPVKNSDPYTDSNVYYKVTLSGLSSDEFFISSKLKNEKGSNYVLADKFQYTMTECIDYPFYAVVFNNSPRAIERVNL